MVGDWVLTMVCTYVINCSLENPTFLDSLEQVLESSPTGDSIILMGNFNTHVANDHETWMDGICLNDFLDLKLSSVRLLDFSARQI